jgi:hypothetical protein
MRTAMKNDQRNFSTWVRYAIWVLVGSVLCTILSAGCSQIEGSRCNPVLTHDECDNAPAVQCVQINSAACAGEAYCCKATMNADGTWDITSTDPNCVYLMQGCPGGFLYVPPEAGTEAGDDGASSSEAAPEASTEAGPAATPDSSGDATPDVAAETSVEASSHEGGADASTDAGPEASSDATTGG